MRENLHFGLLFRHPNSNCKTWNCGLHNCYAYETISVMIQWSHLSVELEVPTCLTNSFHYLRAFANVCGPCMDTLFTKTPIFAWYMARHGHQDKMSIGLDSMVRLDYVHKKYTTIWGSRLTIIGNDICHHLKREPLTTIASQLQFWYFNWHFSRFKITNWISWFLGWSNSQNVWVMLELPMIGPQTLTRTDNILFIPSGVAYKVTLYFSPSITLKAENTKAVKVRDPKTIFQVPWVQQAVENKFPKHRLDGTHWPKQLQGCLPLPLSLQNGTTPTLTGPIHLRASWSTPLPLQTKEAQLLPRKLHLYPQSVRTPNCQKGISPRWYVLPSPTPVFGTPLLSPEKSLNWAPNSPEEAPCWKDHRPLRQSLLRILMQLVNRKLLHHIRAPRFACWLEEVGWRLKGLLKQGLHPTEEVLLPELCVGCPLRGTWQV